jgi:hypothetical protein
MQRSRLLSPHFPCAVTDLCVLWLVILCQHTRQALTPSLSWRTSRPPGTIKPVNS